MSSYWRLISHFQDPAAVFASSRKELLAIPGIKTNQVDNLLSAQIADRSERQLSRLEAAGGLALSYEDAHYPTLLKQLIDPPPVLYCLGNVDCLTPPSVAMVGSRAASAYGKRVALGLANDLGRAGMTVVSGLALGIDTESHRGALAGGGTTIAVLGCGLDVMYPPQNRSLCKDIIENGLVMTEYPLGTRPDGFRFPARNRIIAGISKGVVVVEAAKKSGSLITAQIAIDYGREVFAVPGQVDSFKSQGAHWLLQQGAKLVQSVDDILDELGLPLTTPHVEADRPLKKATPPDIDPEALSLLADIDEYPQHRETLLASSGLSFARLSELLLFLELEGLIELLPGGKLCKVTHR